MPKRIATTDLNHENWNEEDKPEKQGTFPIATQDMIEKRIIKPARRRLNDGSNTNASGSSVFSNFQGFSKTSQTSSTFNFLKQNTPSVKPTATIVSGESSQMPHTSQQDSPSALYTPIYIATLAKLNECFLKCISNHLEKNKYIVLTPCFKDYERHLKSLLSLNNPNGSSAKGSEDVEKKEQKSAEVKVNNPGNAAGEEASSKIKVDLGTASQQGPSSSTPMFKQVPDTSFWFKSFTPAATTAESVKLKEDSSYCGSSKNDGGADEEGDSPPRVEFKPVVEEGAVYEKRCKMFVKRGSSFQDHGVGMLYLKPVEVGGKTQLIVRADTSLGKVLVNTLLSVDMSMQKMGKNNVLIYCIPNERETEPVPVLLRVKTNDDADELLSKLNEHKK